MGGIGPHGELEWLKSFCSDIQDGHHVSHLENLQTTSSAILKVFNFYLLPNSKSDGVYTWWKASGWHGDLELLKCFHSDIRDCHHGNHLEIFKSHLLLNVSLIEIKHDGRHWGVMEIQNC